MRNHFTCRIVFTLSAMLVLAMCFSEAQAQRRRRPSRRITHPVRSQPVPLPAPVNPQTGPEATIVSTADEPPPKENKNTSKQATNNPTPRNSNSEADQERMRRTIDHLSGQVTELSNKLNQMKDQQNTLVDLERLSRAEQRAENFRTQLRDVLDKESALQARLEQIDYDLRPESIQMRAALVGTLRPDEVREAIRRQLESEKTRVRKQLDQLASSRVRLEAAVASAETEVDRLRARIDAADNAQPGAGTNASTQTRPAAPVATTPTTTAPQEDAAPPLPR